MTTIDTAKLADVTGGAPQAARPVPPPEPPPTMPPPPVIDGGRAALQPAIVRSAGWSWFWGNSSNSDQN